MIKTSALAILFSLLFVQANANTITLDPQEKLEMQVAKIINSSELWASINEEVTIKISFMINTDGELIVLSTDNKQFDRAAKLLLNYQKIEVDKEFLNKKFILPVRLTQTQS